MRKGARIAVGLVACAFTAGNLVVAVSAAPVPTRAVRALGNLKSPEWTSRGTKVVAAHQVDAGTRARTKPVRNPNAHGRQLLVQDPAAYAAGKTHPKATPGYAISEPGGGAGHATSPRSLGAATPNVNVNFTGITTESNGGNLFGLIEPPDTQIAVGPTWIVEMTNSLVQVYDKAGNPYPQAIGTFDLNSLFHINDYWVPTYFPGDTMLPSDPRVLYDPSTGRYYASAMAFDEANTDSIVLLGVSNTSDPALSWTIYALDGETTDICDQPKLGYSSDKIVVACTFFDSTLAYAGALLMAVSKSQAVAHVPINVASFTSSVAFGLVPAQNLNAGVAAAYVVSNEHDRAALVTLTGNPTISSGSVAVSASSIPMNPTAVPPAAPQAGSAGTIDTGDDRFMSAVVQGGVLYTSGGESCTPMGDTVARACLRLVEINLTTKTLIQGDTAGIVGTYVIDPTLGVNSSGDVVLVYTTSSEITYPDVELAIQPVSDPSTFVGGGQLVAGLGPYEGSRWGDYGVVAVDPSSASNVWVAGEWSNGPSDGTAGVHWATQIGQVNARIAQVCTLNQVTSDVPSPQGPASQILLAGDATCVANATPEFQFWIKPPGGTWAVAQDYQNGDTYPWTQHTTLGVYSIQVRVRGTTESTKPYDSYINLSYEITAAKCSVPTLDAQPAAYPQLAGTPVTLTASTTCGAPPALYQFWIRTPDLVWHLVQDYSASNVFNWTTLNTQLGSYSLSVHVKNTGELGSYDNYVSIPYAMQLCTASTLSTGAATSPYASGSSAITLTAGGSCAGGTQFQFHYKDLSNVWHLLQPYSTNNTATWNADYKPGTYTLQVAIRPVGSSVGYVTYTRENFELTGCGVPTLSPDKSSPQLASTMVTWTASATCSGTPEYEFWLRTPAGVWSKVQAYSPSNTFVWNSPSTTGVYAVQVRARNAGASEDPYDNYQAVNFTLVACTASTISTGPATSPYASGSSAITLTAGGSCAGGTQFQFHYKDLSNVWHLLQPYSTNNTATWNADYKPGTYTLQVAIRPVGSSVGYVTYTRENFELTGCGVPTLSPDKSSPQLAGTTVTWTASATCSGTPEYEFWLRTPAGVWSKVQAYSPSNTFVWNSPSTTGVYAVQVRARNAGASEDPYDNYKVDGFTLT